MARPKLAVRSVEKNISIPEDLVAAVELELFSEVEGKVPFGAWKGFITRVIRQYVDGIGRKEGLAKRLVEIAASTEGDPETRHMMMDKALAEELAALGYHRAVSIFHNTPKMYA